MYKSALFRRIEYALTYLAQGQARSPWLSEPNPDLVAEATRKVANLLCDAPASAALVDELLPHLVGIFLRFGIRTEESSLRGIAASLVDAKNWDALRADCAADSEALRHALRNQPVKRVKDLAVISHARQNQWTLLEYPGGAVATPFNAIGALDRARPRYIVTSRNRDERRRFVAGVINQHVQTCSRVYLIEGSGEPGAHCSEYRNLPITEGAAEGAEYSWLLELEETLGRLDDNQVKQVARLWAIWLSSHVSAREADDQVYLQRLMERWLKLAPKERVFEILATRSTLWADPEWFQGEDVAEATARYRPFIACLDQMCRAAAATGRFPGEASWLTTLRTGFPRKEEDGSATGVRLPMLFAVFATCDAMIQPGGVLVANECLAELQTETRCNRFLTALRQANAYDGASMLFADTSLDGKDRWSTRMDVTVRDVFESSDVRFELDASLSEYPVHIWAWNRAEGGGPCRMLPVAGSASLT
jgi:hypothetical protein